MFEKRNAERVLCGDYLPSGIVLQNISSSGALLASEKQMAVEDTVIFSLRLGPVIKIELNAIVKWCKPSDYGNYMMGVSFGKENDTNQLNRYIAFLRTLAKLAA